LKFSEDKKILEHGGEELKRKAEYEKKN